jgi:hypothetical protein
MQARRRWRPESIGNPHGINSSLQEEATQFSCKLDCMKQLLSLVVAAIVAGAALKERKQEYAIL